MSSPKIDSYDVTAKQREVLEWRHAKRQQLRHEYLREYLNPMRQDTIVDSAYGRYAGLRIKHEFTRIYTTGRQTCWFLGIVCTVLGLWKTMKKTKVSEQNRYRRGEVKYADRQFKFI